MSRFTVSSMCLRKNKIAILLFDYLKYKFQIMSCFYHHQYERQLLERERARQEAHERRLEELRSSEKPFEGMMAREQERQHKEELRQKKLQHKCVSPFTVKLDTCCITDHY